MRPNPRRDVVDNRKIANIESTEIPENVRQRIFERKLAYAFDLDKPASSRNVNEQTAVSERLRVGTRIKEAQSRNLTAKIKAPSTLCHIPLVQDSEFQRQIEIVTTAETDIAVASEVVPNNSVLSVDQTKFMQDEEIVTNMMMHLSSQSLEMVKQDFVDHGGDLELNEFVEVMMQYQPSSATEVEELNTVAQLCGLFSQVDINGDGSMEWAEFTSHIVESSQDRDNFRVDVIKNYNPSHVLDSVTPNFDSSIEQVYYVDELDYLIACDSDRTMKIYNANDCSLVKQAKGHLGVVHDVVYLTGNTSRNYLVSCANDSTMGFWDVSTLSMTQQMPTPGVQVALEWTGPSFSRLFSSDRNGIINTWDVNKLKNMGTLNGHTDMVMDLHSIPTMGVLASASLDSAIKFWDISTLTHRKSLPGHKKGVLSLSYSQEYRFLVSAGFDHDALVWNPYVERMICPLKGHTSSLVGVKVIPGTPEIVTADASGIFKIWDIRNFSCVQTFSGKDEYMKTDQVADDYSAGSDEFGADHKAIYELLGRDGLDSKALEASGNRLSLPKPSKTRRQFEQTCDLYNSKGVINCFAYATKYKRIVSASNKLRLFDYDQPADAFITDSAPTIGIIYNDQSLTFTTAGGTSVKLWDAQSGRLLRIYRDITDSEITALCLDDRKRKFIVGDHRGNVSVFNVSNGAKMKDLSSHNGEIVSIHSYSQIIISCSWDGKIKISDEADPEAVHILHELNHQVRVARIIKAVDGLAAEQLETENKLRDIKSRQLGSVSSDTSIQRDLTAVAFSPTHQLLASAAADTTLCVHRANTGVSETVLTGHQVEISCVVFLDPLPILASADTAGNIFLWDVSFLIMRSSYFARFSNSSHNASETGNHRALGVACMHWHPPTLNLYTGDEYGFARVWNLKNVLKLSCESKDSFFVTDIDSEPAFVGAIPKEMSFRVNKKMDVYKPQPEMKLCWRAHEKSIKSIGVIQVTGSDFVLATSSLDLRARIWSQAGHSIGSLFQGSAQDDSVDQSWSFPVDRTQQKNASINHAKEVMKELGLVSFDRKRLTTENSSLTKAVLPEEEIPTESTIVIQERAMTKLAEKFCLIPSAPITGHSNKDKALKRNLKQPPLERRLKLTQEELEAASALTIKLQKKR